MDISNFWIGNSSFSLKHVLRLATAALILASLSLAYAGWLFERNLTAIKTQGVEATATVLRGRDERHTGHAGYRRVNYTADDVRHTYHLTLNWTDGSGGSRTYTRKVSQGLFFRMADAAPEARQVSIRYLPGSPDVQPFIATEIDDTFNGCLYGAIGLFALGLGAAWLGWPPRRATAMAVV